MKGLTWIVVFCMAAGVSETKFVEGPCPTDVSSVPNFNLKNYEGIWYTQYRTPFEDNDHDCSATSVFYNGENGYFMKTYSSHKSDQSPDVKRFVVYDNIPSGTFRMTPLGDDTRIPATNWVLATDYKTYSVRFSCYNKAEKSHQVLSLQTRHRLPSPSILNKVRIAASTVGFSLKTVNQVNQEDCPELANLSNMSEESDSDGDYDQ